MGFKLSCGNDLETLKNMESIYKEESHIHQFIIPFDTTVWNKEDLPPQEESAEQRSQYEHRAKTPAEQQQQLGAEHTAEQ